MRDHLHGQNVPRCFKPCFKFPSYYGKGQEEKLRGVEDKMQQEGYKHKTNKN